MKTKKLFSILLALSMVIVLIPSFSFTVGASFASTSDGSYAGIGKNTSGSTRGLYSLYGSGKSESTKKDLLRTAIRVYPAHKISVNSIQGFDNALESLDRHKFSEVDLLLAERRYDYVDYAIYINPYELDKAFVKNGTNSTRVTKALDPKADYGENGTVSYLDAKYVDLNSYNKNSLMTLMRKTFKNKNVASDALGSDLQKEFDKIIKTESDKQNMYDDWLSIANDLHGQEINEIAKTINLDSDSFILIFEPMYSPYKLGTSNSHVLSSLYDTFNAQKQSQFKNDTLYQPILARTFIRSEKEDEKTKLVTINREPIRNCKISCTVACAKSGHLPWSLGYFENMYVTFKARGVYSDNNIPLKEDPVYMLNGGWSYINLGDVINSPQVTIMEYRKILGKDNEVIYNGKNELIKKIQEFIPQGSNFVPVGGEDSLTHKINAKVETEVWLDTLGVTASTVTKESKSEEEFATKSIEISKENIVAPLIELTEYLMNPKSSFYYSDDDMELNFLFKKEKSQGVIKSTLEEEYFKKSNTQNTNVVEGIITEEEVEKAKVIKNNSTSILNSVIIELDKEKEKVVNMLNKGLEMTPFKKFDEYLEHGSNTGEYSKDTKKRGIGGINAYQPSKLTPDEAYSLTNKLEYSGEEAKLTKYSYRVLSYDKNGKQRKLKGNEVFYSGNGSIKNNKGYLDLPQDLNDKIKKVDGEQEDVTYVIEVIAEYKHANKSTADLDGGTINLNVPEYMLTEYFSNLTSYSDKKNVIPSYSTVFSTTGTGKEQAVQKIADGFVGGAAIKREFFNGGWKAYIEPKGVQVSAVLCVDSDNNAIGDYEYNLSRQEIASLNYKNGKKISKVIVFYGVAFDYKIDKKSIEKIINLDYILGGASVNVSFYPTFNSQKKVNGSWVDNYNIINKTSTSLSLLSSGQTQKYTPMFDYMANKSSIGDNSVIKGALKVLGFSNGNIGKTSAYTNLTENNRVVAEAMNDTISFDKTNAFIMLNEDFKKEKARLADVKSKYKIPSGWEWDEDPWYSGMGYDSQSAVSITQDKVNILSNEIAYNVNVAYKRQNAKTTTVEKGISSTTKYDNTLVQIGSNGNIKVFPSYLMGYKSNTGSYSSASVMSDKPRTLPQMYYNSFEIKGNIETIISSNTIATDRRAVELAQKLSSATSPVIYSGGQINLGLKPNSSTVEYKTYTIGVDNSTLNNQWGNTNEKGSGLHNVFLNSFKTNGKLNVNMGVTTTVNGKELVGTGLKNQEVTNVKSLPVKRYALTIKGTQITNFNTLPDHIKTVANKMELKTLIANQFQEKQGLKIGSLSEQTSTKNGFKLASGYKDGDGWYTEETDVLYIYEYETEGTITPKMSFTGKIPLEFGPKSPINKNDLFKDHTINGVKHAGGHGAVVKGVVILDKYRDTNGNIIELDIGKANSKKFDFIIANATIHDMKQ